MMRVPPARGTPPTQCARMPKSERAAEHIGDGGPLADAFFQQKNIFTICHTPRSAIATWAEARWPGNDRDAAAGVACRYSRLAPSAVCWRRGAGTPRQGAGRSGQVWRPPAEAPRPAAARRRRGVASPGPKPRDTRRTLAAPPAASGPATAPGLLVSAARRGPRRACGPDLRRLTEVLVGPARPQRVPRAPGHLRRAPERPRAPHHIEHKAGGKPHG